MAAAVENMGLTSRVSDLLNNETAIDAHNFSVLIVGAQSTAAFWTIVSFRFQCRHYLVITQLARFDEKLEMYLKVAFVARRPELVCFFIAGRLPATPGDVDD